jgi:hypothetical protein
MGRAGAGLFLAVLVVAALGSGYLAVNSGRQASETVQGTSVSSSQTVQGNALGSDGFQLFASLNASQLAPGQALQVNVSMFNTFSTTNSAPVEEGWAFQGIPLAIWPDCDTMLLGTPSAGFDLFVGAQAVVLKGYYLIGNLTSVARTVFQANDCTEGGMNVKSVVFEPRSSEANLTGWTGPNKQNETVGPYHVGSTFTTNGYWDPENNTFQGLFLNYEGQQTIDSPTPTPFTPGTYTVGIEDVWGQAVVLHFTVTN